MREELIPTSTRSAEIEAASLTLAAVLAGHPDLEAQLAVAEALSILCDVTPPYPPLPHPERAAERHEGVATAHAQLDAAIGTTRSVEEALRCAHARRALAALGERAEPS
jgi:hypothetical protein